MRRLTVDHPPDEARTLVEAAFERTRSVASYTAGRRRVVGHTQGVHRARFEVRVVEADEPGRTVLEVSASARGTGAADTRRPPADPSELVEQIETLRGHDGERLATHLAELRADGSKADATPVATPTRAAGLLGRALLVALALGAVAVFGWVVLPYL
jgi:hypothetical protein